MSAISALWVANDGPDPKTLQPAIDDALSIYGPHGRGRFMDKRIALSSRLSNSLPEDHFDTQPLWAPDRSCCIVSDVRLDNRPELADSLSLPHPETLPDSAILMAAWVRWGPACVEHLLGAFAFAVWVPSRQELWAVRDHTGERPLFYYRDDVLFAVASVPRGLLAIPGVRCEFNQPHMAAWLAAVPPQRPGTCFESIRPVGPGYMLRITPDRLEAKQYWHPSRSRPIRYKRDQEYAEALVEILDRATAARLRSTQPVGSFLSAGLDSSAVTSSAARLLNTQQKRLTAFTSVPRPGYDGPSLPGFLADEGAAAAEVARLYPNIDHVLVNSAGYAFLPTLHRWAGALDEPPRNVINFLWLTAILDQAKARGIGVMLEGVEGNGAMSWYTWSILGHFFKRGRWLQLVRTARALHGHAAISYKTATRYALRPLMSSGLTQALMAKKNFDGLYDRLLQPDLMSRYGIRRRIFNTVYHRSSDPATEQSSMFGANDLGPFRTAAQALTGIELRDPTGDKRIYEFCFAIPPEQYVAGGHSRSLIRRAMAGRLPDSVRLRYTRGQQGADWYMPMTEDLAGLREELELNAQSPAAGAMLDLPAMQRLLENWPATGFRTPQVYRRWEHGLIPAISLGHFLRYHEAKKAAALTSSVVH